MGRCGMLDTIPEGFAPGSEIANLSVLGYNVPEVFEGRGSLEAASMGIGIEPGEMAMRCNLICVENGNIKNHSAGHISSEEAEVLIRYLQQELGDDVVDFYPGVSYRHLLKVKGGNKNLTCTPPHDVPGTPFEEVMVKAATEDAKATAEMLRNLVRRSQELLENHPVNLERAAKGKDKANSIWPWSPGYRPAMKTLQELFGIKGGAVISAVDLIRGIGVYAGLEVIMVEGATGLYDTNYEGKTRAALEALRKVDFVFLHIEASDEAGHEGDVDMKVKTIEYLDRRVVKTVLETIADWDEPVTVALLPDHPTPCALRTHTRDAVPFVIYRPGEEPDAVQVYDEQACRDGDFGMLKGLQFMQQLIRNEN
jgi:2,3-bisphosphoglycerate-independent phosphoglycerate mutase